MMDNAQRETTKETYQTWPRRRRAAVTATVGRGSAVDVDEQAALHAHREHPELGLGPAPDVGLEAPAAPATTAAENGPEVAKPGVVLILGHRMRLTRVTVSAR